MNEPLPPASVPTAHEAHALARLQQAERDIEARVGAALITAEQSLVRRFGIGCLRGLRLGLRALFTLVLLAYFAFGAALLVVRHMVLPRIDENRAQIEALASRALDAQVRIGRIEGDWQGFNPRLKLTDVRLNRRVAQGAQSAEVLVLPQIDATLSWSSLWRLTPRFHDLSVLAPELEVRRLADGRWLIAGFVLDPSAAAGTDTRALDWVLGQRRITIRDARVLFIDETSRTADDQPRRLQLEDVQIRLDAGWRSNRFAVRATPPTDLAASVDVRAAIERPFFEPASALALWSGRVFAQTDFVDLAQLKSLLRWLPGAVQVDAAQGALRTWVDFDQRSVRRVAADLALADVDVRLGTDLAPLALDSVQGRFAYREFGPNELNPRLRGGHELILDGFAMTGRAVELGTTEAATSQAPVQRVMLPPTRLRLQLTPATDGAAASGEFEATLISLDQLSALAAHVPLGRELRAVVARHAVGGELTQLSAHWEGDFAVDAESNTLRHLPARYDLKTRFSKLSSAAVVADPPLDAQGHARMGMPGFQNLAGEMDVTAQGGTIKIESTDVTLEFPGVFEAPRKHFAKLSGTVQWSPPHPEAAPPKPFELQIQQLTAINEAVNLTLTGTYRSGGKGPGLVDLSARIDSAQAQYTHEYLPLSVGPGVRTWLRDALLAGTGTDGTLRLRGDLADFPYADGRSGEFRVSTHLRGGVLDFAPHLHPDHKAPQDSKAPQWPVLRDIEADVIFDRNRMLIVGQQAVAEGVTLKEISAQIPDLGTADARLQTSGKLRGPLERMLAIAANSPVGPLLGDVLSGASAKGEATSDLNLDIPLTSASTQVGVKGTVTLKNNDLTLRILPPLTQTSGQIEYTDHSLRLTNVRGGFLGGQVQMSADTLADSSIVFKATGTATPAGVRGLTDVSTVLSALDRSTGTARYNATVTLRGGKPDIRVESDLVGWAVDLPSPLGKLAATPWPLRVLLTNNPNNTQQDRLQVNAGSVLALRLDREARGTDRAPQVVRGAVRITDETTNEPPALPDSGVRVDVALARLDLDRWAYVLYTAAKVSNVVRPNSAAQSNSAPDLISARVQELRFAGKPIANVVLGASRVSEGAQSGSWQVNIESDQASGSLLLRPAEAGQEARVTARLARLTIPEAQRSEFAELLDAPVTEMPAFDVIAENFELGQRKLGHLELVAQNIARTADRSGTRDWQLQKLEITNPDGKLSASGQWARDPKDARTAPRRMALNYTLDFSNGGALLTRLGIQGALRGTSGKLEGDIAWRGSPFALDVASLSGQVRLNADKGQFLKADAGAGRLLGVMSLQSLPRRLTLDFRDVFSEGFAFDSIRASADIQNGVLSTSNLRMRGVSATVLMEGSADLAKETQNLRVLVLPEINAGSASLLYAALANPAIGIGTFLAQLFLRDPLAKAFSFEYDVTGSWADPQVKRRAKPPVAETVIGSP